MQIMVAGISHRSTTIKEREKFLALADNGATVFRLLKKIGITEALTAATCNRFEVYAVADAKSLDGDRIRITLESLAGLTLGKPKWYVMKGERAVRHIFRVAAGLDAMVVGETQVLGQIKMAYQKAWEDGTTGPILNRLLHKTFFVAKRIHTETEIAKTPVSVASIAAAHAARLVGEPKKAKAIVVGAGEMGKIATRRLVRDGFSSVSVSSKTDDHALAVANTCGASLLPWNMLSSRIADSDVMITALAASRPVIEREVIEGAARLKSGKVLHIIDIGTPRNVTPNVKGMTGVNLLTIDDLGTIAKKSLALRRAESKKAEELVEKEAAGFAKELSSKRFSGTIASLNEKFEEIRTRETARLFESHPKIPAKARRAIDAATKSIVAKILHDPASYLKDETLGNESKFMSAEVLKRTFKL